ncbi:MAG: hypothetical protein ABIN97_00405 [Ginsengibacter sp.]
MLKQTTIFIIFLYAHFITYAQGKLVMNGATMNATNSAYIITTDVSLTNTSTLNINNSTIKIAGDITNNSGIFDVTAGTVEMNGASPQTIPGSSFSTNKIMNLIISNNVTLAGEDSLTGVFSFGSSNKDFATGGLLTLKSTFSNTARVADITNAGTVSGNTITGNVRVERFVQPQRAWRLLTTPVVANSQTISEAWQEGQTATNTIPGFGTHITGGSIANGFDQGVNLNPSLKIYTAGAWVGVSNTNATSITNLPGYMLFVRGGRDVILSQATGANATPTVVRSTGQLKTNSQSLTVAAAGFTVIGNPYASPVNLSDIAKSMSTNIQDNFYLWDPKITGSNGVGGYVNVLWNGSSYDITPPSGGSGLNQYVQSGSAFLAKTINGTTSGTLVIKETDKSTTPAISARGVAIPGSNINTNLYTINSDGTKPLVDGILNSYASLYSNSIDQYDALKVNNFSESLSSQRDGKLYVVERRQPLNSSDTIFLNMLQMKVKSYQFEVVADNITNIALSGFLEDSYLNTSTPLNLQGTTTFDFNVINVPGSWNPNRFRVVFKQATVLPVTFSAVKAFEQNDDINVEWKVENEINIKQYDIEKSANGQQFVKVKTVIAKGNNSGTSNYNWLDETALQGNNYYRIKSVGLSGEIQYSVIVKVYMSKNKEEIVLKTNVITGNIITLEMNNMPKGTYAISITNNLGQIMFTQKIEHDAGSSSHNIQLNKNISTGIYHLNIIKPDLTSLTMKLLMQ